VKKLIVYYHLICSCLDQFPGYQHDLDQAQLRNRISLLENISSKEILLGLLDFKTLIHDRYLGLNPLYSSLRPILNKSKSLESLLEIFDERFLSLYASF
jgi:hypothetical protein